MHLLDEDLQGIIFWVEYAVFCFEVLYTIFNFQVLYRICSMQCKRVDFHVSLILFNKNLQRIILNKHYLLSERRCFIER